jgi:2-hydroxy-3-keto-5-methylthiopentenyl-1-phosphate phosphatase
MGTRFKAVVSSDWNECLAPSGPFDFIAFNFPNIGPQLTVIFRQYTGNQITLRQAVGQIRKLIPDSIKPEQMDAYLDAAFATYTGVPDLIEWCLSRNILFMINTTGMIGYFQRIFARGLLPRTPVISAHPMVRYPESESDPTHIFDLLETGDKAINTEAVIRSFGIPSDRVILMGDSGGDGPHFEWGSKTGAYIIGSMTKSSLDEYCSKKNIKIDLRFGIDCIRDDKRKVQEEMQIDFMDLATTIEDIINR